MKVDSLTFRIDDKEIYEMLYGVHNFVGKTDFPETSMVTKTAICRVLSTLETAMVSEEYKRRANGGISPDVKNPRGARRFEDWNFVPCGGH